MLDILIMTLVCLVITIADSLIVSIVKQALVDSTGIGSEADDGKAVDDMDNDKSMDAIKII